MSAKPLRVGILSSGSVGAATRLAARLIRDIPDCSLWVLHRMSSSADDDPFSPRPRGILSPFASVVLKFLQGDSFVRRPNYLTGLQELCEFCQKFGLPLYLQNQGESATFPSQERVLHTDILLCCGADSISDQFIASARMGALYTCLDYAIDNQSQPRQESVSRFVVKASACWLRADRSPVVISTFSFDLQPFDTDMSLRIKSELIARDLLIAALRQLVVTPNAQFPEYRSAQISASVPNLPLAHYHPRRGRPRWNLFSRTLLFIPFLLVRNWYRRAVGRFPVIILYHHLIADRPHRFAMPTSHFINHVRFLKQYYSVCSLSEALLKLQRGCVTSPTVVLTFDDGYRDNYLTLRAVAEEFAVPVCLFLCTDHLTSGKPFDHDLRRGQADFFPLTWEQVAHLRKGGFEIGSHTRTHFDCGSSDERLLHEEIVLSRQELERHLAEPVEVFSFPWGHPGNISPTAMRLAQETYAHVFSAYGGQNFPGDVQRMKHLRRKSHPADLWELELAIQSVLDL